MNTNRQARTGADQQPQAIHCQGFELAQAIMDSTLQKFENLGIVLLCDGMPVTKRRLRFSGLKTLIVSLCLVAVSALAAGQKQTVQVQSNPANVGYFRGTTTISATPIPGYIFRGWQDGRTDNPRTIQFGNFQTNLTAYFQPGTPAPTPATFTNVTVAWSEAATNVSYFTVYRGLASGLYDHTVQTTNLSLTESLALGTNYFLAASASVVLTNGTLTSLMSSELQYRP